MKRATKILPKAIVLSHVVTGLATVRGIAKGGVEIHCVTFQKNEPTHFSRYCKHIKLIGLQDQEEKLIHWIIDYSQKLGGRPVVIPTSDAHALMLAKNSHILLPHCRIGLTSYKNLQNIIYKNNLYKIAEAAGIPTIPSLIEPSVEQIVGWSSNNVGPYFLKPAYEGNPNCSLTNKNMVIESRDLLISYATENGTEALIIQRFIQGGDGYIFDCYGTCDCDGHVVTMASHRRWRQMPQDTGTTTYGEIPAAPENKTEKEMFALTEKLINKLNYNGIFGLEWLQDRETGDLFVLDFNARPFSSIGHLTDCGLNLPLLAYKDLIGESLKSVPKYPKLKHSFWIDAIRDLESCKRRSNWSLAEWLGWIKTFVHCRSFAYWDLKDLGPGLFRTSELVKRTIRLLLKMIYTSK
jgi:D-aspartate ligase